MHERAFPPPVPWEPGPGRSRGSEPDGRRQCQDLCLPGRTLRQIGVGLEAGKRADDKLLVS